MKYICLLTFFCAQARAQQLPDYLVYLVKGNATLKKGKEASLAVKQNQFVFAAETITINKGAELTLTDKDGKIFLLNTPGNYGVASLSKRPGKTADNLTQKYLHLLYHELLDPEHDFNKFKKQNIGGVWGGVSRGDCGNLLFPMQGMKTAEKMLLFKWRGTSKANSYVLSIYDSMAREVLVLPATDTLLKVDATKLTQGVGLYYWRIQGKDADCEDEKPLSFEMISGTEEERKLAALSSEFSTLATKLGVIDQLDKDCFIPAAQKYFQTLVLANATNTSLLKTYSLYLLKYHLEEEAKKIWEAQVENKLH